MAPPAPCPRSGIRSRVHTLWPPSVVRQHTAAVLNAMNTDFERATGTWQIEWLALPEIFCYTAGALAQAKFMLSGLGVDPDNMMRNLRSTDGLVNSEAVMMALGPRMGRGKAHDRLSAVCMAVAQGKGRFIDLLAADTEVANLFDGPALEKLIDSTEYLGASGAMVDRVLEAGGR